MCKVLAKFSAHFIHAHFVSVGVVVMCLGFVSLLLDNYIKSNLILGAVVCWIVIYYGRIYYLKNEKERDTLIFMTAGRKFGIILKLTGFMQSVDI